MDVTFSSDDDSPTGQAFPIPNQPEDDYDLDIPPTSGNEYLRRVRMEASSCPQIVVAEVNPCSFKDKQTVHVRQWNGSCYPAPKGFAPSKAWQKMQVDNFSENRLKLARSKALLLKKGSRKNPKVKLPLASDVTGWCRMCFGPVEIPAAVKEKMQESAGACSDELSDSDCERVTAPDDETAPSSLLPLVSIVAQMDQPSVLQVLEYHLNWFEATGFKQPQGYWLYALLLSLDKPLLPDACDLLRRLARASSNLRASLESPDDPRLTPLNLFICIVSLYFDQSDLRDEPGS